MHGRASNDDEQLAAGHRSRLRKRLLDAGPEGFHDYELLEYLLALTIPRVDTKPLAKRLLHDFGGIGPLLSASAGALRSEGLTDPTIAALKIAEATALRLLEARVEDQPVLSSWDALGDYLHAAMAHRRTEEVRILFLNAKNVLIANEACGRAAWTKRRSTCAKSSPAPSRSARPPSSSSTTTLAAIPARASRTSASPATWSTPGGT